MVHAKEKKETLSFFNYLTDHWKNIGEFKLKRVKRDTDIFHTTLWKLQRD